MDGLVVPDMTVESGTSEGLGTASASVGAVGGPGAAGGGAGIGAIDSLDMDEQAVERDVETSGGFGP